MARPRDEKTPERARRLKYIYEHATRGDGTGGLSQLEFSEQIYSRARLHHTKDNRDVSQQAISRYLRGERALKDEAVKKIVLAFPEYNLDWLLGSPDAPRTRAEKNVATLKAAIREGRLLDGGFRCMAEVAGFTIEDTIQGEGIEEIVPHLNAIGVSRDGLSGTLTLDELNELENQVLDYLDFLLSKRIN